MQLAELGEIAKGYTEHMVTGEPFDEEVVERKRFLRKPKTRTIRRTPVQMRDRTTGSTWYTNAGPGEVAPGYSKEVKQFSLPRGSEIHYDPDYRGSRD